MTIFDCCDFDSVAEFVFDSNLKCPYHQGNIVEFRFNVCTSDQMGCGWGSLMIRALRRSLGTRSCTS